MGTFSLWHWLVVLLIVVLVFGTKKLKNIGTDLGGAVKGFKDGIKDGNTTADEAAHVNTASSSTPAQVSPPHGVDKTTIDVQAKQKS